MSRKSEALRSVFVANNRLSGARITQVQRAHKCRRFVQWCFDAGYPVTSLREVQPGWVKEYLKQRSEGRIVRANGTTLAMKPLSQATLLNELAAIRQAIGALGLDPAGCGITAAAMGLRPRSRKGTKRPIADHEFDQAVSRAIALGEVGFSIVLRLERYLGLRGQESLMSTRSLAEWARECESTIRIGLPTALPVENGTKGGRARVSVVLRRYARETLDAIRDAMNYVIKHGHLLHPSKPGSQGGGLKFARAKYHRLARRVGLIGDIAPHAIRYRYTVDLLRQLVAEGYPQREALALAAQNLGHGAGRTDMVRRVYGASIAAELPRSSRREDVRRVLSLIEQMDASGHSDSGLEPEET